MTLTLAISPCPNDTYIFDAWINGKLPRPKPRARFEDIDRLNQIALAEEADVVKISFAAFAFARNNYALLQSGGALGRGCGPLIVTSIPGLTREDLAHQNIRVGIPGALTTANLLLTLYQPKCENKTVMAFDQIMPAIQRNELDAGLIIHESRFTYPKYGLHKAEDLGSWWERETNLPIPLGCVAVKKSLGEKQREEISLCVRHSLEYARANPGSALEFMKKHAQEMDADIMKRHVDLYVNEFSLDYGEEGRAAIDELLRRATECGFIAEG